MDDLGLVRELVELRDREPFVGLAEGRLLPIADPPPAVFELRKRRDAISVSCLENGGRAAGLLLPSKSCPLGYRQLEFCKICTDTRYFDNNNIFNRVGRIPRCSTSIPGFRGSSFLRQRSRSRRWGCAGG